MGKVTIKELQERLQQQKELIDMQQEDIIRLNKELEEAKQGMNVISLVEFNGVVKQCENVELRYKVMERQKDKEIERLKDRINQFESKQIDKCTIHNERGAGRKSQLTPEQSEKVYSLHQQGLSYGKIATEVGISKAYVYKLISKQNK
jgi:DNA-binding NarL/FixJ family response regulator